MEYIIPYPYIWHRRSVQPYELHRGSVVAFKTRDRQPRTGIIIMDGRTMMMAAVNLYKEEGRIWYLEDIPDDIDLFESNKEERLWGYKFFLEEQCGQCKAYEGKDPFVAFIENECPQGDNAWGQTAFCQDFLSYVPHSNRGTVLLLFKKEAMVTIQQKSDNISKAVSQLQELLKGIEE